MLVEIVWLVNIEVIEKAGGFFNTVKNIMEMNDSKKKNDVESMDDDKLRVLIKEAYAEYITIADEGGYVGREYLKRKLIVFMIEKSIRKNKREDIINSANTLISKLDDMGVFGFKDTQKYGSDIVRYL